MYEKALAMKRFSGMYTSGDGMNLGLHLATEAINCNTEAGSLKPMTTGSSLGPITLLAGTIEKPIGTLMRIYRRFASTDNDVFVAVADGRVFYKLPAATYWAEAALPEGHTITDNSMDFVTYEVNKPGSAAPTDVLLFTNNTDGMFCLYGDDWSMSYVPIGDTGYKLGVVSRHYERIWGANLKDSAGLPLPDTLIYSQAYDPFNWSEDAVLIEDDAGEIDVPSWDGDKFLALRTYGAYLLALKRNSIWRVMGSNPSEYILKEQFGGGPIIENTVAIDGMAMFMLGENGLMVYEGTEVSPFKHLMTKGIFDRVNPEAINKACAVVCGGVYYLAIPLDDATENNAILEYNITESSFNLRMGVSVTSFLKVNDTVHFTSSANPYDMFTLKGGTALPLKWVSSWQDLNAANIVKSGFGVYVSPKTETGFDLKVSIETEKKIKTKVYQVPTNAKYKRLRLSNIGRKFRIILESSTTTMWELTGGAEIHMETDED